MPYKLPDITELLKTIEEIGKRQQNADEENPVR